MMIKKFMVFALIGMGALAYCSLGMAQSADEYYMNNVLRISDFNEQDIAFGTYETEGYVVYLYKCPKCPKGAHCEPCVGEHIVISEEDHDFAKFGLTNQQLKIFVKNARKFRTGKRYRFLVQVLDVKSMDQEANNLRLIHYKRIKDKSPVAKAGG